MTVFVADIGGTNSRLALVANGVLTQVVRFENDAFASFYDVLQTYLDQQKQPQIGASCIAIAGPVSGATARLTNRDWHFDANELQRILGSPVQVRLANDLAALGFSLANLNADQTAEIRAINTEPANDQALVAGLGTGFNVCLIKRDTILEAELGHASQPSGVLQRLQVEVGDLASGFSTIEDLFSGPGLARLDQVISGQSRRGHDILRAYEAQSCADATRTVDLFARLLGVLARDLVLQYLPYQGLYFAGSAARGVLGSRALARFLEELERDGPFVDQIQMVPVRLITDDAAALIGAARYASL
ncbi:MAG: glucokinase [Pseudomonadota bacterium]